MNTTVSVCTLCFLLCVAGSYAQTNARRMVPTQPGSSRTLNTMETNDAAHDEIIRSITQALQYAIQALKQKDYSNPTLLAVEIITSDLQTNFAKFIDDGLESGHGVPPSGDCTTKQINVDLVSKQFSQVVCQALVEYKDDFIKASSECLPKAVLELSLVLLPLVNEERCIYEGRFATIDQLTNRFDYNLSNTVENVMKGLLEGNENKARNCYTSNRFIF